MVLSELIANAELIDEEEAQRIAARASLWVYDLIFHPDAASDDAWIQRELMDRYAAYFQSMDDQVEQQHEEVETNY